MKINLQKHILFLLIVTWFLVATLLSGCAQMPNDYRLADVRGYTMWADIQRAVVVCMDGGGYAQLHRKGSEPVHVWCFKD